MENVHSSATGQPELIQTTTNKGIYRPSAPRRRRKLWGVLAVLVVLVVASVLSWVFMGNKGSTESKKINTSEYQAVFLTNGQVYFGHLSDLGDKYVSMKNIYYLQVQQSQNLQQGKSADANSQVSLAKLGSELHGPEDQMNIASGQVLFWENLKPNSKVSQAINKYQNQ